jgi:hypothetical protein
MKIVGGMKISPFIFYSMTLREAKLAIKGHKNEMHEQYILNLYATTNSIGSCFGGKKYKMIDPFDDNSSNNKSMEDKKKNTAEYASFLRAFGIDARDVSSLEHDTTNWEKLSTEEKRNLLFKE